MRYILHGYIEGTVLGFLFTKVVFSGQALSDHTHMYT